MGFPATSTKALLVPRTARLALRSPATRIAWIPIDTASVSCGAKVIGGGRCRLPAHACFVQTGPEPREGAAMPTLLATLKVKKDKIEEAKEGFRKLTAQVRANEPGTQAYVFHQRKDDPSVFVVYEKYASDEGFKPHGENLRKTPGALAGVLEGRPEITFLDEV